MSTNQGLNNSSINSFSLSTRYLQEAISQGGKDAVSFVSILVREAVALRASDILLEPQKNDVRIRVRIDGALFELGHIPLASFDSISSRIKVLAQLDPTEKRKVQEGQFTIEHDKKTINVRVEIAITIHGELIVMRIHEMESIVMELSDLGLSQSSLDVYLKVLEARSGLILVCGPTSWGKTPTLFSTIIHLNFEKKYNV